MSNKHVTQVLDCCPEKGSELCVLIVLANRANKDGGGIWADIPEHMARAARVNVKTYKRILQRLIQRGRVQVNELERSPRGGATLRLTLPTQPITAQRWEEIIEAKRADKRTRCKTLGRPKQNKTFQPAAASSDQFEELRRNFLFQEENNLFPKWNYLFHQIPPFSALSAVNLSPYYPCTTHITVVNKVVYNARAREAGGELIEPLSGECCDNNKNLDLKKEATESTDAWLHDDDWLDELQAIANQIPHMPEHFAASAAAQSAELDEEFDPLFEVFSPAKDVDAQHEEKCSAAAGAAEPVAVERVAALVGSPEWKRLEALCGGGGRNPYLPSLLEHTTPSGHPRSQAWLKLTLDEIERAREAGHVEHQSGRANSWRGGFIFMLDTISDEVLCLQAKVMPKGATPIPGRPRPNPWRVGQRVACKGELGVIASAFADARQASVVIDLDDDRRITLMEAQFVHLVVSDAPLPVRSGMYPIGSVWRDNETGETFTVEAVEAAKPRTTDGQVWPAFGKNALNVRCLRVLTLTQEQHELGRPA